MAKSAARPDPTPLPAQRPKIFVSYSRADMAFADELVAGLEYDKSFDALIDRFAIHEAEDWRARLGTLIAQCDAVAFILTPTSAQSPVCHWEVDEALRLSKKVVPVLAIAVEAAKVPPKLAALNYVRFDPDDAGRPRSFMAGLASLRRALTTDIDWIREHTRLLVRAIEWESSGRAENRLLYGGDIAAARAWQRRQPKDAPPPTEQHIDFIAESEVAEAARNSVERQRAENLQRAVTRTRAALTGSSVLAAVLAVVGYAAYANYVKVAELAEQLKTYQRIQQGTEKPREPLPPSQDPGAPARGKGEFLSKPKLEVQPDGSTFRLAEDLVFRDGAGKEWRAPKGFVTDLASIPQSLWTIVGSPTLGRYTGPAILHDYYVGQRKGTPDEVNLMFYEALLASGVSETQAKLMYTAVARFGPKWTASNAK